QFSNWSSSSTFTTTGTGGALNDDCASATLLTVGTTCDPTFASNVDATSSIPPPVGGCSTTAYKDVWFKFTMPNVLNPTVTIRTASGSLANAVMEVYTGTQCGILSVITCEDNNDNGNGSAMPVINLTGTANMTIWVRVWGIDGATGTFTICVFNGISFNSVGAASTISPEDGVLIEGQEEAVNATMEMPDLPELFISPNPVSDQLNVVVRQTKESHVIGMRIVDLSGEVVLNRDFDPVTDSQFKSTLDVSGWAPGIYVLQVQTTKGILSQKITVMN
ncbi:MAG: T9SS type A sorting domain-containing protein, partial [Saprospiraceae bacterium]